VKSVSESVARMYVVRERGLEPLPVARLDPKSKKLNKNNILRETTGTQGKKIRLVKLNCYA